MTKKISIREEERLRAFVNDGGCALGPTSLADAASAP